MTISGSYLNKDQVSHYRWNGHAAVDYGSHRLDELYRFSIANFANRNFNVIGYQNEIGN